MYLLTNKSTREIALPAPCGAVILAIGACREVPDAHYAELCKSPFTQQAIRTGAVVAEHLVDVPEPEPEPLRGVELVSQGSGQWIVLVNGHAVTDGPVNKREARRIASEYEAVDSP
jgi:hypothetical protein